MTHLLHIMQSRGNGKFAYHAMARICISRNHAGMQNRLKQFRGSMTLEEMSARAGVSVSQLSRWEKGKSNIPSARLPLLAEAYGCRVQDIFGEVDREEAGGVPVIGFVGAGGEVVFEDAFERGDGLYHIEALPGLDVYGMIGLEVRGDSMYPVFRSGYVVFIRRDCWDRVEEEALSDWAVCRLADGRTLLKEVRRGQKPGRYDLVSQNAPPIEDVELLWATPIQGHRRRK